MALSRRMKHSYQKKKKKVQFQRSGVYVVEVMGWDS